jgi:hypothetical protein
VGRLSTFISDQTPFAGEKRSQTDDSAGLHGVSFEDGPYNPPKT